MDQDDEGNKVLIAIGNIGTIGTIIDEIIDKSRFQYLTYSGMYKFAKKGDMSWLTYFENTPIYKFVYVTFIHEKPKTITVPSDVLSKIRP